MESFPCPCCGHLTLRAPPGSYDICPVCFWEDDVSQLRFPLTAGGANRPSLLEAQGNYQRFGASERAFVHRCRPAAPDERVDDGWRPLDLARDHPESPTPGTDYGGTYPADATALYYWRPTYWRRAR